MAAMGWLWNSMDGGVKYIRNLIKTCNKLWEENLDWDGLSFMLLVMFDI